MPQVGDEIWVTCLSPLVIWGLHANTLQKFSNWQEKLALIVTRSSYFSYILGDTRSMSGTQALH